MWRAPAVTSINDSTADGSGRGAVCHHRGVAGRRHRIEGGIPAEDVCTWCFVRAPALVRRAALTALVIGTVLTLINHPTVFEGRGVGTILGLKIALTYAVPYVVTVWGAMGASARRPSDAKETKL